VPGESLTIRKLTLLIASERDDDTRQRLLCQAVFRFEIGTGNHKEERG